MPPEQFLQSQQIAYTLHEHPAVYTCEDAAVHCKNIPGLACKNLFLKGRNSRYFLVIVPATKRIDLKKFAKIVGEAKVSFASAETLKEKLHLEPGSVSPLGLLNDTEKSVEVYIDKALAEAEIVGFHPNRNTATLELSKEMFHKFLGLLEQKVHIIEL